MTAHDHPDAAEDFDAVAALYDGAMEGNNTVHDLIYPRVYGEGGYVGQFSDNSADELVAMAAAMDLGPGSRVLDVGCGTAPVAALFARRFDWRVTGIDVSATPLAKGRERIAAAGLGDRVRLVHGEVYRQAFDHPFDGAYGTGAFCHFDPARLFARCAALLRPGGRLAFMERVRTGGFTAREWRHLTAEWACPTVSTAEEYRSALSATGFRVDEVRDLTPTFRDWQDRSVVVRRELRAEIVALTSVDYYETSLRLADYENAVTRAGKLGYVLVVATNGAG
ncbi:SAM-dependent methyltransferase [Saccharothrix algeriensis]|uniref:Class I SAM-dependent methyltransferase n=1 Tax=Saccharothrix algeriensis TaxID=173560 RepID=A0A8T8HVJ9_9PSEU|nr:class I SAM-dependent methyltransferase [Saccharothrix algeriensis]MBM7814241.1 cyclopropane fatty-acyl-phospholipid synthase-like methyltransferase [Saccharothrix algeriensis]QTR02595.1 class I SAM-dependent methyltransferase [Saccharothrix algeriensis]